MKKLKQLYQFLSPKFYNVFLQYPVYPKPRYGHGKPAHPLLFDIINQGRTEYENILNKISKYEKNIQDITETKSERVPYWNNGYLPALDMMLLYTIIADKQPFRYIEIGSGHSTKMAYKAKVEHHPNLEIISIDPNPRTVVDQIADKIVRITFEDVDLNDLNITEGDVLFVDNSHMVIPNSDAMVFFMEVLPVLPKGVLVHLHDIYLPFDYPQFMCNRHYNEQYTLAAFLLSNPDRYKTILPTYFVSQDSKLSAVYDTIWDHKNLQGQEKHGGSYWIEIQ